MDESRRDMVIRLCSYAGTSMEDTAPLALRLPGESDEQLAAAIARIRSDVAAIAGMVCAASALVGADLPE